jgi:hypothetical protein
MYPKLRDFADQELSISKPLLSNAFCRLFRCMGGINPICAPPKAILDEMPSSNAVDPEVFTAMMLPAAAASDVE